MIRTQRLSKLWEKCQLLGILASKTHRRIDRDLRWAAEWEVGLRDGTFDGGEYPAQERCVRLANEVLRLRGSDLQTQLRRVDVV